MTEADSGEALIRLGIFLGAFLLFATLETLQPRRQRSHARIQRWPGNIGMVLLSQLLVRVLVPTSAVVMAVQAADAGAGALNRIELPVWLELVLSLLLLDLLIYGQHIVFHKVPWLWRIHRMHHTDTDFDISTALRFHPVEILLSACIKLWGVFLIGPTALAVLIFEVVLNASAMFNHSNLKLPAFFDQVLRLLIVTPDMHRVHHSVIPAETNANFGFNFPWWDRLFGTYRAQPSLPHESMTLGLDKFRDEKELRLDHLLTQPFREPVE